MRSQWKQFEDDLFRDQPAVEAKALALWKTDRTAARTFLTQY